jgi:hypothetical protein
MKESDLNREVLKRLAEFERIENIEPSSEWNDSLTLRIEMASGLAYSPSKRSSARYSIIITLILLLNIGLVLNSFFRNSQKSFIRNRDLNVISKELMVNPVSLNF